MAFKRILVLSAVSLFSLSACDGYEAIKTNTMFPYGNQRTAGSGVAYVLAKMLPKKELKLEQAPAAPVEKNVERNWKPEVMEMLPKEKGDEIFLEHGKK